MEPYYQDEAVTLYCCRMEELVPQVNPSDVGLVLTDPPYGADTRVENTRFTGGNMSGRDKPFLYKHRKRVQGDDKPFHPAPLLQFKRCILWGGQYYASRLPDSGGWIVWDKRKGIEDAEWPLSEAELAWTNLCDGIRVFRHRWFGLVRETEQGEHYHPNQKPVALMRWIIERWTKPGDLIADFYAGSGPVCIAAKETGRRVVACEVDEEYCAVIVKRLRQQVLPLRYATPQEAAAMPTLWGEGAE